MNKLNSKNDTENLELVEKEIQPENIQPKISVWRKFRTFISILNSGLAANKYLSYLIILSFPIFCAFLIYLMPRQPSIPHPSSLQEVIGKFDYIQSDDKKPYGQYTIDGKIFNCAQILRSYPFDNCYISSEIKAFKQQIVQAKWYNQEMGFGYKPILVEMTFDADIQIMGIEDTQKLLNLQYKKNKTIFNILVPSMFIVYFGIVFIALYFLYKKEKLAKANSEVRE